MLRKVVAKEGFRFSDGTLIPYGSFLSVSGRMIQHDPGNLFSEQTFQHYVTEDISTANYDHAEVFDGFRFSRMREEQSQTADEGFFKSHMISTGPAHLPFGHGKHACPGR